MRHVRNVLLRSFPAAEFAALAARFEYVELRPGLRLIEPFEPIRHLHFVENGMISIIACPERRDQIETGLVGREGVSGLPVALGFSDSPFRHLVQSPSSAFRIEVDAFMEVLQDSSPLQRIFAKYAHLLMIQMAESARTGAKHTLEERLARWLLMAHDRCDGDDLFLTHDFISLMLHHRRPSVTISLQLFEGEHIIQAARGRIRILDRAKLLAKSRGAYGVTEAQYQRAFGPFMEAELTPSVA